MTADAPLWLVALGILVLPLVALAAGALGLCRYDQRHDRDIDLDVALGRQKLRYRSRRPHDSAQTAGHENVHPLPARRATSTGEQETPASRPAAPAALAAARRAHRRAA